MLVEDLRTYKSPPAYTTVWNAMTRERYTNLLTFVFNDTVYTVVGYNKPQDAEPLSKESPQVRVSRYEYQASCGCL